jgi:filamentous hemagglutinin family protein
MDGLLVSRLPGRHKAAHLAAMLLLPIWAVLQPGHGLAQVTPSSVNSLSTVVNPALNPSGGTTYTITGGTQRGTNGSNLFYSFGLFGLSGATGAKDVANFCNATACGAAQPLSGVANILGRVTDGQPSNIQGTIQTTGFGTANLWLINPAGWIFGPTATLSVGGSFRASTAGSVKFPDGIFAATDSPLAVNGFTTDPTAFGFLNGNPAAIRVDAGASLAVPSTSTLSLIGGDGTTIAGLPASPALRTLRAPSGHIQIASVASAGDVAVNPTLDVSSIPTLGLVNLRGAFIDVSGNAGDVVIRGGRLVLTDSTRIQANTTGANNPAPVVDLLATGSVEISGGSKITSSNIGTLPGGALTIAAPSGSVTLDGAGTLIQTSQLNFFDGLGGDVIVQGAAFSMSGGAVISSFATVKGGNVRISATGAAVVSGAGTGIANGGSLASPNARVGDISVNVGRLTLTDGATITNGSVIGRTGNVTIEATDSIVIANGGGISSQAFGSNVGAVTISAPQNLAIDNGFISTSTSGSGNAGPISINVGTLTLTHGGQIASSSVFGADGKGGDTTVTAGLVSISGSAATTVVPGLSELSSGLFSTASGNGPGGNIAISSPQIQLLDGGTISASSTGSASALAGNVKIVTNDLTMKGNSSITTQASLADGGNISVTTNGSQVYLLDSQIATSVESGVGSGGNITLGSGGHPIGFIILNGSQIRADAHGGSGGNISLFADTFLSSESVLSASSALAAPGVINVQARFTNLSGNITQLPETVLQAAALLRAACAARLSAGRSSSLVVAGREGVPPEPGGIMPSPLIAESPTDLAPSRAGSDGREWEPVPAAWRVSLRSKCSM